MYVWRACTKETDISITLTMVTANYVSMHLVVEPEPENSTLIDVLNESNVMVLEQGGGARCP